MVINSEKRVIEPTSIILARDSRGITQKELSKLLNLSQGTMSKIEIGITPFPEDAIEQLSTVLNYPINFFFKRYEIYRGVSLHRKRLSISQKKLNQIDAITNIVKSHIERLLISYEIEVNLPHYEFNEIQFLSKEKIAKDLRVFWKVPKGPIPNITQLLEKNGILIFNLDFGSKLVDGLSLTFKDLPPLIFMNNSITGDRYRFTLAHELGHILMHQFPTETMEEEANLFASEFLAPGEEIKPYLDYITIQKAIELKRFWKISIAAILVRAKQLNKITERQYRYLWMNMGKFGYKSKEPIDIPIEQPTLIKQLIDEHLDTLGYTYNELQEILCLNTEELSKFYLGHRNDFSPNLRLVENRPIRQILNKSINEEEAK